MVSGWWIHCSNSANTARWKAGGVADDIVNAIEAEAKTQGFTCRRLPSGAGHDAQIMASVCPSGMIFVPCVGGISHNINEHTEPADLIAGGNVLLQVVLTRAQRAA